MKVAVLGGGPAGLYFAISMKLQERRARGDGVRAQPRRRHVRLGRGAVRRDARQSRPQRPGQRRRDPRALRLLGRHRRGPQGRAHRLDRARLLRHRPQAAADAAAGAGARTRRRPACSRPRSPTAERYMADARPGGRRRRPELGDARRLRRRLPARHRHRANASSSGSARTRSSTTPSPSSSRRPSTAGCGRTPTSSTPDTATFIVECSQETWDAFGFGDMTQQESIAVCERIFAKHLGGHALMSNANHIRGSAWINFPRVLCERWSSRERRADGRRGGERAFLDRLGHQAGARKRDRAGRLPALRARRSTAAFDKLRGRAAHRGAEPAVGGAQFARMVRGGRALPRPRPGAVHLFAADPLAAHQPREPAAARPRLAGRRRGLVPAPGRRRRQAAPRAPMFAPFQLREHDARTTASSSRRWRSTRRSTAARPTGISPITPSAPRAAPAWSISR